MLLMEEKLRKQYPWLYSKKKTRVVGKRREFYKVELNPIVTDHGNFWTVTREKDASPLILSKEF